MIGLIKLLLVQAVQASHLATKLQLTVIKVRSSLLKAVRRWSALRLKNLRRVILHRETTSKSGLIDDSKETEPVTKLR